MGDRDGISVVGIGDGLPVGETLGNPVGIDDVGTEEGNDVGNVVEGLEEGTTEGTETDGFDEGTVVGADHVGESLEIWVGMNDGREDDGNSLG